MDRLTENDCLAGIKTGDLKTGVDERKAFDRLASYEDTGMEPEEIKLMKEREEWQPFEKITSAFGVPLDRICELAEADKDGRCTILPCKLGDTVYTIEEDYFDCENCKHQSEAKSDPEYHHLACKFPEGRHCPYYIKEHVTEGFNAGTGGVSGPGEWGYEGLEHFAGIDGKWYPTREAAEKALEAMK